MHKRQEYTIGFDEFAKASNRDNPGFPGRAADRVTPRVKGMQ
jgi:hypothetical protein